MEPAWFYERVQRKRAQIDWICVECGSLIEKGSSYVYEKLAWKSERKAPMRVAVCMDCSDLMDVLKAIGEDAERFEIGRLHEHVESL